MSLNIVLEWINFKDLKEQVSSRRAVGNSDSFCLFGAKKDKNVNGWFYFY